MEPLLTQGRKGLPIINIGEHALLFCGIASSLLYVAMTFFIALLYEGYNSFSQTISELSAIDAPTRPLWVLLGILYTLLVAAFGWGIWKSAVSNQRLRITGGLVFVYGSIGLFWPFAPMHQREVIAAGGATLSDTMHIVFSIVTVFLMLLAIGFGATALGKKFRLYSIITIVILLTLGPWTGMEGVKLNANLPTPWIGVIERALVGVFLLWIVVLAIKLLRDQRQHHLKYSSTKKSSPLIRHR